MGFCELIDGGASKTEQQAYLADGDTVAVTIRIPRNLRDSAKEIASLKGMSFSALIRMSVIETITEHPINVD